MTWTRCTPTGTPSWTRRGEKGVSRAWCLFAGAADGASRPMIAYGPPAASVVGALRLRPGDTAGFERLCQLLSAWGLECVAQAIQD